MFCLLYLLYCELNQVDSYKFCRKMKESTGKSWNRLRHASVQKFVLFNSLKFLLFYLGV